MSGRRFCVSVGRRGDRAADARRVHGRRQRACASRRCFRSTRAASTTSRFVDARRRCAPRVGARSRCRRATRTPDDRRRRRSIPTADVVPENQLRLYIHFSAPMGLKGGLDYIHLLDDAGNEVKDPFLPLDTEFWNDDRTRYTVFFDPGRQKRGIAPIAEMGRSLTAGKALHARRRCRVARRQRAAAEGSVPPHVPRRCRRRAAARSQGVGRSQRAAARHARSAGRDVSASRSITACCCARWASTGADGKPSPATSAVDEGESRWTLHAARRRGRRAATSSSRSRCWRISPATASAARSKSISSSDRTAAPKPRRR